MSIPTLDLVLAYRLLEQFFDLVHLAAGRAGRIERFRKKYEKFHAQQKAVISDQ